MTLRILGAGGHAKVAMEAWRSSGGTVSGVYDDDAALHGRNLLGLEISGPLRVGVSSGDLLHIAIGDSRVREQIASTIPDDRFPTVAHAGAYVSPTATLAPGILVCAGAVVQAEATIGRHVIVNSLALVEHDVTVGDFAHVGPGSRLGGGVQIGVGVLIGIGAVVLPGLAIGDRAVIGAGAVVIGDVSAAAVLVGNPARPVDGRTPMA